MGAPLQPAGQQQRGGEPGGQAGAGAEQDARDHAGHPVADGVVADAHRHLADDPAVGEPQRHLAAGGAAQRALLDRGHAVAVQRGLRVGADPLADPLGVGVREPDAVQVGDHHEARAGGQPDLLGVGLRGLGVAVLGGQCDGLVGGGGLGDGQGALHRVPVQLGADRGEEQPGGHGGDADGDDGLAQQQLGEDPAGPVRALHRVLLSRRCAGQGCPAGGRCRPRTVLDGDGVGRGRTPYVSAVFLSAVPSLL